MQTYKDRLIASTPVLSEMLKNGPLVASAYVDGAVAGDIVVANIKSDDELIGVMNTATGDDLTSEFSITDDGVINNDGGTSSASGYLLVLYHPWTVR